MRAILTFHSIDHSGSAISVTPATFRAQIEWLVAGGVRVVSVQELLELTDRASAVALTFDDGIANICTGAEPVLAHHGMSATVFVVTRRVGQDNHWTGRSRHRVPEFPLLSWPDLERVVTRGWTVGSHSRTHPDLRECSEQQLADEVEGSADDLAAALGGRPRWFAYPYGRSNQRVVERTAACYEGACTAELRPFRSVERFALLPRIDARYLTAFARRLGWGTPGFQANLEARRLLRAVRAAAFP